MAPHIVLHWLDNSRAQRVVWMLEELGLNYEVKRYKRQADNMGPPELKEVHPLGRSPVVTITDGPDTVTLAESGAIIEFLVEHYGQNTLGISSSAGLKTRADYLYWLHFVEGSGMLTPTLYMIFSAMPKQAPWFLRPLVSTISSGVLSQFVVPRLTEIFDFVEKSLEGKQYIVGDKLTGADINLALLGDTLTATPLDFQKYPNIRRWHAGLKERPAYKAAEAKGDVVDFSKFVQ
ncbi:hypothetical protein JCM8097_008631 [Rhodosporidiobolus ruineniae]